MGSPDYSTGRSPRRELQGPRPTPLKINKDSRKIKKPPLPPAQPRPPVIIYTVSPKVIHTNPSDFKDLVQRLTGQRSSSSSGTSSSDDREVSGAVSPAAHYATVEKANNSPEKKKQQRIMSGNVSGMEGVEMSHEALDRTAYFPAGILSPAPTFLPPVPSNLFTPPADPSPLSSFFQDLSPIPHHGNRNFIEGGSFMPSPSYFISPHQHNTSNPSVDRDFFSNFPEFH